jgi:DNA-directed RNA polymerase subunit RPC12/RpoP
MIMGKLLITLLMLMALPSLSAANTEKESEASPKALEAASKTFRLLGDTAWYPVKTLGGLWKLFKSSAEKITVQAPSGAAPETKLAGYSPEEYRIVCSECNQETVVRGKVPGLALTCPACGKKIH